MVKEFFGMMFLVTLVIVFGTNAVTDHYNAWALMAQFGGK